MSRKRRRRYEALSDDDLARLWARRDPHALPALIELYEGQITATIWSLAEKKLDRVNEEDVKDAMQKGLTAAWVQSAKFNSQRAKLKTWIVSIIWHKLLDIVQARARAREVSLPNNLPASHGTPNEVRVAAVHATLDSLPQSAAGILRLDLRNDGRAPTAEVMQATGMKRDSVFSSRYRARRLFKAMFEARFPELVSGV